MKRGFTIVELMIVIAIIVILAAIAFPAWQCHKNPGSCPRKEISIPRFDVVTDPSTGCEYFQKDTGYAKTLTPRYGTDGKQICKPPTVEAAR